MTRLVDGTPGFWAVEIHDLDERNVLAFDLGELLEALGARVAALDWLVVDFDPVTDDAAVETLARRVYDEGRVRLTSRELRAIAGRTRQTIDGLFIGFASDAASDLLNDLNQFASSPAAVAIKAVDSTFWVVITKAMDDIASMRARFSDVRDADALAEVGKPPRLS